MRINKLAIKLAGGKNVAGQREQEIEPLEESPANSRSGLFITDFDSTLLRSDGTVAQQDIEALESLARLGVKTAIATGRSLYSFINSPGVDLPVDYIIFSTGAGVLDPTDNTLLYQLNMPPDMVTQALVFLKNSTLDFMMHHPVPENHKYVYRRSNPGNTDFETRIEKYNSFCEPLCPLHHNGISEAAQFLAVVPKDQTNNALEMVRNGLPGLNVIRATSPLDHQSGWIEVFHPDVSKGRTAAWLASQLGVNSLDTMAIGNDYNDLDLLEWAEFSYVVDNAPDDLKKRFQQVASNDHGGVSDAVHHWIGIRSAERNSASCKI